MMTLWIIIGALIFGVGFRVALCIAKAGKD